MTLATFVQVHSTTKAVRNPNKRTANRSSVQHYYIKAEQKSKNYFLALFIPIAEARGFSAHFGKTTKELIAESFIELSANRNVDKIKIKEITDNCGLTPTTFYNHFQDKYDLIVWIYTTMVENAMNRIDNESYEWKDTLLEGLKYSVDNRQFLVNYLRLKSKASKRQ